MKRFIIEMTEKQCDTLAARSRLENKEIHSDEDAEAFLAANLDKMIAGMDMYDFLRILDKGNDLWGIDDNTAIHAKALINKAEGKI